MIRVAPVVAAALLLGACGSSSPALPAAPAGLASSVPSAASLPSPSVPTTAAAGTPAPGTKTTDATFVVPVLGTISYERTHHDYPATDIMAPCGATAVAPTAGVVLEVTRVDKWNQKTNLGADRGGLSVSILGDDNVRYYGSHFGSLDPGINPGVRVTPGMPIAKVGRTGDASACHEHFGLSPICQRTGDWWIRRGVIWPWSYLDAWKAGTMKSPLAEVTAWQQTHGCPTKALVDP